MKASKILALIIALVTLFSCLSIGTFADNTANLDLDENTSKDIDQNYTFKQTGDTTYTDVYKVKLAWTVTDIAATYASTKTWNPDTKIWDETKTVADIADQTAKFTLTNYSSKKVAGTASFTAETALASTLSSATFDDNNGKTIDTMVNDDKTIDETKKTTVPSNTITATLKFNKDKFADLTATTSATKYGTYTITILSKKGATITAPSAKTGLTYTCSEQELVTAGKTDGGEWQYKLNDGTYSAAVPTATNAGTYTVYYKLVGGEDYNDIAEASVEVTVAKATQTITLDNTNVTNALINDKDTVTITIPAGQGETTYGYSATNDASTVNNWQTSNTFTFSGANGDRYFFAKYAGNENYEPTVSNGQTATICFAAGTKITMADGTLKNIEDITEGEEVLTFNHEKGIYEAQKVYIAWHGAYQAKAFTLHFDNGETLSIAGMHDLFEQEALCYVEITKSTAEQFIGKHFYSCADGKYVELTSVTYETEATDFYSLYTEYNTNCIAEGFLSVPVDVEYLVNIYEFNEDLTIDHEQLEKDIAEFGLYEYPANATYPEEWHEAYGWKYLYLFIGKGFGTEEYFYGLRDAFLAGEY